MRQIRHAVEVLGSDNIILCHATSTYPAQASELNLKMIYTLQGEFPNVPIGYSGHETGLQTTLAAVAMGATFVELKTNRAIRIAAARFAPLETPAQMPSLRISARIPSTDLRKDRS